MLGLDFSEIIIIGVVALVVVGPKELPQMMRTAGQWIGKARRMAAEFQGQMNEAIRDAELEDVRKSVDDLRALSPKNLIAEQFASVSQTLDEVKRDTDAQIADINASAQSFAAAQVPAEPDPAAEAEVAARIDDMAGVQSYEPAPLDLTAFAAPVEEPVAEPVAVAAADVPADEAPAKPKRVRKKKTDEVAETGEA